MRKQKSSISKSDDDFVIENIYAPLVQSRYHYANFCYRDESFQVYINQGTLTEIFSHAVQGYQTHKGEIAGALIGNVYRTFDNRITFVEVNAMVPAMTFSTHTSVTIPENEWSRINELLETDPRYRSRCTIVGWYHSHPGFGIFMSDTDRHTHVSHFSLDWQIAIVVDPKSIDMGCFYGPNVQSCSIYKLPELADDKLVIAQNLLAKNTGQLTHAVNKSVSLRTIVEKMTEVRDSLEKNIYWESPVVEQPQEKTPIEKNGKSLNDILSLQSELTNELPKLDNEIAILKQKFDELRGKLIKFFEIQGGKNMSEPAASPLIVEINHILVSLSDRLEDILRKQNRIESNIYEVKAYLDESISLFSTLENTVKAFPPKRIPSYQEQYIDSLLDQFDVSLRQLKEFERRANTSYSNNQFRKTNILKWVIEIVAVLLLSLMFGLIGIYLYVNGVP